MTIRYSEVRKMCDDLGVSVAEVERECGFAKGSLSKIDQHKPRKEKLDRLMEYFKRLMDSQQYKINELNANVFTPDITLLGKEIDSVYEPQKNAAFKKELEKKFSIDDIEDILKDSDEAIIRRINKYTEYLLAKKEGEKK